jgi:hypothetical protein
MNIVGLFLLLNLSFAHAIESSICDDIVNFSTGSIVRGLDKISDYFKSDSKNECSQELTLKDQLFIAIEEEDLDKFNNILDKLESSPLLKLLGKIKSNDTTELKKFRKFATEKFLILIQRLSENEKKIMREEPIKTFFAFFQYNNALNYIRDNDKELYKEINTPFGKADSIRHMFINASASRFGMSNFVKKLSTQRELSGGYITYDEKSWKSFQKKDFNSFHEYSFEELVACNPTVNRDNIVLIEHEKMLDKMLVNKMDIHNNAIGITLGKENSCSSLKEIYSQVKKQYKSGKALEIVSSNNRCFDVASNPNSSVQTNDHTDCLNTSSYPDLQMKLKVPRLKNGVRICI